MIVLGRIAGPYGLQGWVKVHPFGDEPLAWCGMPHWWLAAMADQAPQAWQRYPIEAARQRGTGVIAKLEGIDDRTAADAIAGRYVGAPRQELPKLASDEYYWADLIGLEVVNTSGERLGKVASMLSTGAHQVLQVQDGDQERLLPFVARVITEVDTAHGVIRVDWSAEW